jgi:hypothetical protein
MEPVRAPETLAGHKCRPRREWARLCRASARRLRNSAVRHARDQGVGVVAKLSNRCGHLRGNNGMHGGNVSSRERRRCSRWPARFQPPTCLRADSVEVCVTTADRDHGFQPELIGCRRSLMLILRDAWLSRPGARCRDCSRSVSPGRSPYPPCRSPGSGLSTVSAVRDGWAQSRGWGFCCRGIGTG